MKKNTKIKTNLAHKLLKISGILGLGFILFHLITIFITIYLNGLNWGLNAWILDSLGFITGIIFTKICFIASKKQYTNFKKGFFAIFIWGLSSIISRIIDILLLFGIIKWNNIYITPTGLILFSNIISEILFGFTFNLIALIASTIIFLQHKKIIKSQNTSNQKL